MRYSRTELETLEVTSYFKVLLYDRFIYTAIRKYNRVDVFSVPFNSHVALKNKLANKSEKKLNLARTLAKIVLRITHTHAQRNAPAVDFQNLHQTITKELTLSCNPTKLFRLRDLIA